MKTDSGVKKLYATRGRVYVQALNYVNSARKALGKKPLKRLPTGRMESDGDPFNPISRGIGNRCCVGYWTVHFYPRGSERTVKRAKAVRRVWKAAMSFGGNNSDYFRTPAPIQKFLRWFKDGQYPGLVTVVQGMPVTVHWTIRAQAL